MKNQTKLNRQSQFAMTVVAIVVLLLVSSFNTIAQTTYKIGDRVETMSAGVWVEAEILEVKDSGDYVIRYVKTGISGVWVKSDNLRPKKAGGDPTPNPAPMPTQEEKSIGETYNSREPRTCEDTKAPAQGAITAALALKYLNCQMEYVSGWHLYLVENVKVEVGGGIPYAAIMGHRSFSEVDVKHLVYPIRGSFLHYQCKDPVREHVGPPDTNCNTGNNPKATGYCYKTTFGDWHYG